MHNVIDSTNEQLARGAGGLMARMVRGAEWLDGALHLEARADKRHACHPCLFTHNGLNHEQV